MAEVTKGRLIEFQNPPKYDPSKIYVWQPEDKFTLTGLEFAQLYQTAQAEILIPGGISVKQKMDVFKLLESIVIAAVEAGVATEGVQESPPLENKDN